MTTQTLEAVYDGGTFRPTSPLELPLADGAAVRLQVESVADETSAQQAKEALGRLQSWFAELSATEQDEIAKHWVRRPLFRER